MISVEKEGKMALKRVFVIRHGESEEDIDPTLHNLTDDDKIGLTENGRRQVYSMAVNLRARIGDNVARVFLSPSFRVKETHKLLAGYLPALSGVYQIDPRIKNLNWGDITLENRHLIEAERYKVGALKYKFPGGDDSTLYVRRIRDFVAEVLEGANAEEYPEIVLIVTHGFAMRIIIKYLCNVSDQDLMRLANPPAAFLAELEVAGDGFKLLTEMLIAKFK